MKTQCCGKCGTICYVVCNILILSKNNYNLKTTKKEQEDRGTGVPFKEQLSLMSVVLNPTDFYPTVFSLFR